ncbi:stAR-related lipid transfer protein 9-like isoform X2 [Mya arenaria]|uniref:stAR-related lipid transfer protein 9-like isoform X2 n=1 Tax=Mya arenaria TaxID=6604 RepID=UPI0022E8386F|nr:stAR-related lipid transfer protein 9-like isoform X2 [Mya arenaria]
MSNIRVAVRVRPLSNKEQEDGSQEIVQVNENVVRIENIKVRGVPEFGDTARARARDFTFDHVYDSVQGNAPCASQAQASNPLGPWAEAGNHLEVFGDRKQVFNDLGAQVLHNAFGGFNACVFAYGQTGSGKTHTMMGYPASSQSSLNEAGTGTSV